jgi:hypothetical protein
MWFGSASDFTIIAYVCHRGNRGRERFFRLRQSTSHQFVKDHEAVPRSLLECSEVRDHSSWIGSHVSSWYSSLVGLVYRPNSVDVEYADGKGTKVRRKLDGFAARVFQHELVCVCVCVCVLFCLFFISLMPFVGPPGWRFVCGSFANHP